jgi:hypothetical protein
MEAEDCCLSDAYEGGRQGMAYREASFCEQARHELRLDVVELVLVAGVPQAFDGLIQQFGHGTSITHGLRSDGIASSPKTLSEKGYFAKYKW